ncbi:hypothetical protein [Rhizobium sp. Leaf262]|uniref:hypothetical protein n=1 Tax=Rhizobium sp. Leaf262 TaxID=1736312 RepID=UPI00071236D5|nr:hypothetical protein [Rhizobium sp. Leaf262]KQO83556.1 hypothetical protein ASF29_01700 [Rhizobium sp. Leaf262]
MKGRPEFLVDERVIVAAHDRMIASDGDLSRHLRLINTCLECLSRLPEYHEEKDYNEITVLRLGVRCFNSGAAALRLLRCGYFQPAVTMMRDMLEVCCLMDLFTKEPNALTDWLSMTDRERMKHYKPARVRERLEKFDGIRVKERQAAYNMFSEIAAHVNPNGHHLISPDNLTRIGPFVEYSYFRPGIEELASWLSSATASFCNLVDTNETAALEVKEKFVDDLMEWRQRYFRPKAD